MDWKDIAGAVGKTAPLLGTLLGGPAGAALTAAGALAAHALGTEPAAAAVAAALASNPDAAVKLREVELANATQLQALAVQSEANRLAADTAALQTAASDRADARRREQAVRDTTTRVLAYALVGGFLATCGAVLLGYARVDSAMVGALVGYLSAKAEQVAAYYFGSSAGSARKDELLAQSTPAGR